ncbi:uncharacterized protein CDAR_282311 [Caerostris darwini]|uniref:Uncharacterized protein n=1 Tax=Caerostris darwini TaxID=1538125 RepID=A0AAV4QE69_9ARAC|nr:uncharacterized protein CDAR_282311 [Caerostris darwini]
MFLFYPLPVRWNYVVSFHKVLSLLEQVTERLHVRKSCLATLWTCKKLEQSMNWCGSAKKRRQKKKPVPVESAKPKRDRLAIWNQMYLIASMSLCYKKKCLRSDEESPDFFIDQNVYLFDITESGTRDIELDVFYSFYLSQSQFEESAKSTIMQRIHRFELMDIINAYKMFEITNDSHEITDAKSNSKPPSTAEFFSSLRFLPRYDNLSSSGYFIKPLTLHECYSLEKYAEKFSTLNYGTFASDWLQLMSWWRTAHLQLADCSRETSGLMKEWKKGSDPSLIDQILESANDLDNVIASLDLSHGSAELAVVTRYISPSKNDPEGRIFSATYLCDLTSPLYNLLPNVHRDYNLIALAASCSYHNINTCFVILQLIVSKLDDEDVMEKIAVTLKPLTVEFYFEVICSLRIEVRYNNYICSVIEKSMENFKDLIFFLKQTRDDSTIQPNPLSSTVGMWTRTLRRSIEITLHDNQIPKLLLDETVVVASIDRMVFNVTANGILLAHKVFQKDLITEDVLLELARYQSETHSSCLFEISCAQVAHSLVTAYKVMHRDSLYAEDCFWLHEDFPQSEFKMFVDELRRTCGLQPLQTEVLSMEFSHLMREFQNLLTENLNDELNSLTAFARKANELLNRAKHVQNSTFL